MFDLTEVEARNLFEIFRRHYDHVSWTSFQHDLLEKDYLLVLTDSVSGEVRGFSTQQIMNCEVAGQPLRVIFSGDTIIDRDFWGEQELVRSWCRFAGQVLAAEPHKPLFWFLISKGYRTYLFLPLFYREFYPRRDATPPEFEQEVMNVLAGRRFGENYDPLTGLVKFSEPHGQLTPELAEIPAGRRRHPHVEFFLSRNPGYARGDELVCLARIDPENMKSFAAEAVREGLRVGALELGDRRGKGLVLENVC